MRETIKVKQTKLPSFLRLTILLTAEEIVPVRIFPDRFNICNVCILNKVSGIFPES